MTASAGRSRAAPPRDAMVDQEIGWIAAIIGGIAGWLAEQFMKTNMGLVMNIVLGIVGAAIASAILEFLRHRPRRMDRLPDCRVHRRVFVDLDCPHGTGSHSVKTRTAETEFVARR